MKLWFLKQSRKNKKTPAGRDARSFSSCKFSETLILNLDLNFVVFIFYVIFHGANGSLNEKNAHNGLQKNSTK